IEILKHKEYPHYDLYHLSSGTDSQTFRQVTSALAAAQNKRGPIFLHFLEKPFTTGVILVSIRQTSLGYGAALLKVFMPYLTWNTVFDNTRVTRELARKPMPFS